MRILDVGVDSLGTEALKDAVEKARDEKFSPILLSVNGNQMESGCSWGVDCIEGSICRILVCMCWYASNYCAPCIGSVVLSTRTHAAGEMEVTWIIYLRITRPLLYSCLNINERLFSNLSYSRITHS